MESASQMHVAPTDSHGVDSHDDKTQGLPNAVRKKKGRVTERDATPKNFKE